jgi:hypothetical protein
MLRAPLSERFTLFEKGCRFQRNGAKNFLRATNTMLLGAMPFVVEALLWTTIALSAVFVMYVLLRRWL